MLKSKGFERLSFIMIIGGSLGNIFDRAFYSAVPDFIDFHVGTWHFATFNVADSAITVGAFALCVVFLLEERKSK